MNQTRQCGFGTVVEGVGRRDPARTRLLTDDVEEPVPELAGPGVEIGAGKIGCPHDVHVESGFGRAGCDPSGDHLGVVRQAVVDMSDVERQLQPG